MIHIRAIVATSALFILCVIFAARKPSSDAADGMDVSIASGGNSNSLLDRHDNKATVNDEMMIPPEEDGIERGLKVFRRPQQQNTQLPGVPAEGGRTNLFSPDWTDPRNGINNASDETPSKSQLNRALSWQPFFKRNHPKLKLRVNVMNDNGSINKDAWILSAKAAPPKDDRNFETIHSKNKFHRVNVAPYELSYTPSPEVEASYMNNLWTCLYKGGKTIGTAISEVKVRWGGKATCTLMLTRTTDECDTTYEFETYTSLLIQGIPESLPLDILEDSFLEAYGKIEECGQRTLEKATVEFETARVRAYKYVIRVSGSGRGNQNSRRIFGESSGRRRRARQEMTTDHRHYLRGLNWRMLQEETCICPPPKKEEFLNEFEDILTKEFPCPPEEACYPNPWFGAEVTENLLELEAVDCPSPTSDFETSINVTFNFHPSTTELTDEELDDLEDAFVYVYNLANEQNEDICDFLFREAFAAKMILFEEGASSNTQKTYTTIVSGTCRGCNFLFDESDNRRFLSTMASGVVLQHLSERQLQEKCFCPVGNPEERGPTKEEFVTAFNEIIQNITIVNIGDQEETEF